MPFSENHHTYQLLSQNFMKTLMQMFAEEDKGVVFYETVTNLKWQKHTLIECVPVPWDQFDNISQYFKASPPPTLLVRCYISSTGVSTSFRSRMEHTQESHRFLYSPWRVQTSNGRESSLLYGHVRLQRHKRVWSCH